MADFSTRVLNYYGSITRDWSRPQAFDIIFPFDQEAVKRSMKTFYKKYYSDEDKRTYLFGINPGRFGAGVTGIPFTDPVHLEEKCQIPNGLDKRKELSSQYVYQVIEAWGGPASFYSHFYITSICPIGFLKDGKNANYYDDKELERGLKPKIIEAMWEQIDFGANREVAYSLGQGKNFKILSQMNEEYGFFEKILPLPHPRWVMQYRRKKMDTFVNEYLDKLKLAL
jgi:hypothetical protein